jgi:opacity protein-like surface antigen
MEALIVIIRWSQQRMSRHVHRLSKEQVMSGKIATLVLVGMLAGVGVARAQEVNPGPGKVEVTYIPAGAAFFTSKGDSPSFGNYGFGTAAVVNVNRFIGVEGELGAMIATTSDLQFGDLPTSIKAPNVLNYTANAVISPWTGHSVVPYGTAGVGGLTMFERPELGLTKDQTFLTGNFGGGVKWYAPNNRWGLRGDYRFVGTRSKDDAPEFFGRESRYAHRVYAAVIINTAR